MRQCMTLLAALAAASALAFYPALDKAGGVTVAIPDIGDVTTLGKPLPVEVKITNGAAKEARGSLSLRVTDDWKVAKPAYREFTVAPGKEADLSFSVTPGMKTFDAYYPIHAYADFTVGGKAHHAHAVLVVLVTAPNGYHEPWADPPTGPRTLARDGALQLELGRRWAVAMQTHGAAVKDEPWGWVGSDEETGGTVDVLSVNRGTTLRAINMHEPWRKGWGTLWVDMPVQLPDQPVKLAMWTAIRDNNPKTEPPSDGVDFRVYVAPMRGATPKGSASFAEVFKRFSAAKKWEPAVVDLSKYRGQLVTLRLWQGPGPKNDTTCDSAYWGDPTLVAGKRIGEIPAGGKAGMVAAKAQPRPKGETSKWQLSSLAGDFTATVTLGSEGLVNGQIELQSGGKGLVYHGFDVEVDGVKLGDWRSEATIRSTSATRTGNALDIDQAVTMEDKSFNLRTQIWEERGALRLAFSMPGVERAADGKPRFTALYIGPCSEPVSRLYAGFGNVMVPDGPITLTAGSVQLSTRHAGADYPDGLSVVQASSIQPDRFEWVPSEQRCSLVTHHDATISLVPSTRGAFAAARVFRDIANYEPAAGWESIAGRMVIDQWGGTYAQDAKDVERAAAYGLTDSVYLQHVWQHSGYDYRLPDVYPPNPAGGTFAQFKEMADAAKNAGMLFAVHDNYIDFYPDASGFTYKDICFDAAGHPVRAWWNPGPKAQAYRWLPGAFMPWLNRNLEQIEQGFAPTAYFVDVFSSIPLFDYTDESGHFHTKMECGQKWGAAFDRIRNILGGDAPTISEGGHDGLIGHLDAGESDSFAATVWTKNLKDWERVPWHDMASHGAFVLLAGGLGPRYETGEPGHGWGTDDYLSNTMIGGRNPMCDGPCYRRTVMTYWLQHDVCAKLARLALQSVEFVGKDIHRLHSRFFGPANAELAAQMGDAVVRQSGQVWVNRGKTPWKVSGVTLPQYGFVARAGDCTAEIVDRDGISARSATSPGVLFVDARPPSMDVAGRVKVMTRVTGGHVDGHKVTIDVEWKVMEALPAGEVIFVHLCNDHEKQNGEKIASYGDSDLPAADLNKVGDYHAHLTWTVPDDAWAGRWYVRYGIYSPKSGARAIPIAQIDGSRVVGGDIMVTRDAKGITGIKYVAPSGVVGQPGQNMGLKVLDFGPLATNGSFRLLHTETPAKGVSQWRLIPLPGSLAFSADLRMGQLGAAGMRVLSVKPVDQAGNAVKDEVKVEQAKGDVSRLHLGGHAFEYVLKVGK